MKSDADHIKAFMHIGCAFATDLSNPCGALRRLLGRRRRHSCPRPAVLLVPELGTESCSARTRSLRPAGPAAKPSTAKHERLTTRLHAPGSSPSCPGS